MTFQRTTHTAACAWALLASACELPQPSPFGAPCAIDTDCEAALSCDLERRRCLPREPEPPPSVLGRACDEPDSLSLTSRAELASGTLAVTLTKDNTSPAPDDCTTQRAYFVAFEVPAQAGPDGAPRDGMVLSVLVNAGVRTRVFVDDAACSEDFVDACAEGPGSGDSKLTVPLVTPGLHTLRVLVDDPLDGPMDMTLVLTQENCPARFLPTSAGECYGFVPLRGPSRRVAHTVTALDDGMALVAGGRPVDGGDAFGDAYVFDPTVAQFFFTPLMTARAGHSAVKLDEGSVLLVGGGIPYMDAEVFYAPGRYFFQDTELDSEFQDASAGTVSVALGGDVVAVSTSVRGSTGLLARPSARSGDRCSTVDRCPAGLYCIDPLEQTTDRICVCLSSSCATEVIDLDWTFAVGPVDAYRRGAGVSFSGAFGTNQAVFVGGLVNTAPLYSGEETLEPFRGAGYSPHVEPIDEGFFDLPVQLQLRTRLDVRLSSEGGRVVAVGGRDLDENPIADVEVFAPFASAAADVFMLESPRADFVLAKLSTDEVIAIGGIGALQGESAILETTEIVDVAARRTRRGPPLPYPLTGAAGEALVDGSVLVVGGATSSGAAYAALWLRTIAPMLDVPVLGDDASMMPSADTCGLATSLDGSTGILAATSVGAADDYHPETLGDCTGDSAYGRDVVHRIDVPAGHTLTVRASTFSLVDLVLYVIDACPPVATSCITGIDTPGTGAAESLTVAPEPVDRTLWIVLDAWIEDRSMSYSLEWAVTPP